MVSSVRIHMVGWVRMVSLARLQFGQNGMSSQKGKVHLGPNVSSSAHDRGCMVTGQCIIMAVVLWQQYEYYYYYCVYYNNESTEVQTLGVIRIQLIVSMF